MATAVASPKTKTKTFIVLGGSGLVGNFIVKQLLFRQEEQQQQHSTDSGREAVVEVVGLDLRMPVSPVSGVKYHSVDITDADALDSLFQQYAPIDTVFHTVSPPHGLGQKVYFNVNVDG